MLTHSILLGHHQKMTTSNRQLRVFLCHATHDKPKVTALYKQLVEDGIDAWLDKENLIPGQDWELEIPKAVRNSDVVLVCLSSHSVTKEGYVQKEIKIALDTADEKPDGTIFIVPVCLEDCNIPKRIAKYHRLDLYDDGYKRLFNALKIKSTNLGIAIEPNVEELSKYLKFLEEVNTTKFCKDGTRAINAYSLDISKGTSHLCLLVYEWIDIGDGAIDEYFHEYYLNGENGIQVTKSLMEKGYVKLSCSCVHICKAYALTADYPTGITDIAESGYLIATLEIHNKLLVVKNLELQNKKLFKQETTDDGGW